MESERERQAGDPPDTWQEHWFDHRQLLRLYQSDDHCAVYLDPDVRRAEVQWLPRYISAAWHYSKATYGDAFGPDPRIYSIHHAGRHGGGHAGYYVSPVHDYHNVSDCGLDTWRESETLARELPAHEIGHSVESANNGMHGSPAYEIWGDSKWAEFYIYDLYTAFGLDREAKHVYRRFTGNADDFPRRGTHWFRDWFYPLWRDCGQAAVMARFFRLLAEHFPRDQDRTYTRRMNWGEYIHFTSGAAAADLRGQATRAFGWPREWTGQLERAREQFPGVTYLPRAHALSWQCPRSRPCLDGTGAMTRCPRCSRARNRCATAVRPTGRYPTELEPGYGHFPPFCPSWTGHRWSRGARADRNTNARRLRQCRAVIVGCGGSG